jgi:molybdenum cofactor biosynthesis enzyme MoaA
MCAIQFRQDGPPHGPLAFMAWDVFTNLIDQFEGVETLHLQGLGEPLMHPRFFDMVDYAAARGITVTANSNLTLLNRARAERAAASRLDTLYASIDAATPAIYEAIRVRAHFDRLIANLEGLRAAKAGLGSSRPRLRMVTVVMRQNLAELPALVRLAVEHGFESLFIQHLSHDFTEASFRTSTGPCTSLSRTRPSSTRTWSASNASSRSPAGSLPPRDCIIAFPAAGTPLRAAHTGLGTVLLAVGAGVRRLRRAGDALLHGRHAGPGQLRKHGR